ncbi:MAG: hypothetical protein IJW21_00580 [Clostridia bacterium]|nr:hypothetical protein [Clostridia bacterium]
MKAIQNIMIAIVALLIIAGLFTQGYTSVIFSSAAAIVAAVSLFFIGNSKKK